MQPNADQKLTALEQKTEALSQRIDLLQNPNRQLMNRTSDNLFSHQHSLQQSYQQQYHQPYQQPLPPITYSQVQTYSVYPSSSRGIIEPTAAVIVNSRGWQAWSCCMFWFGLFHLLGGIGMIIPGFIILLSESNDCPSPYIFNSGQCCTYSNGYDNNLNSCYSPPASVPGLALTSAGAASGIVGMFLLIWACRFYRNNNNTCCPCC